MAAVIPDRTVRHRLGGEDLVRYTLVVLFAAILYLFVLYPLLQVIWRSLLANDGTFVGWANYRRYFGTPAIAQSISNSLFVSIVSMAITVVLAFVYAYGLTRTRMPGRGLFRLVAMLPLFAPSLVQALAFIYVFGNNGILTRITGLNVGIYGAKGIVLAEVFYCFPHAVLILVAALSATDARLYDAARTLGVPRYAVQAMQSTDIFTVGGSISVNAHGMDHQAGAMAKSMRSKTCRRPMWRR